MSEGIIDGANLSDPDRSSPGPDPARADSVILPLLAAGATIAAAAGAAGFSERTVRRRLKDQDFRRTLQDDRLALRRQLVDRLVDASLAAVGTLASLAEPGNGDATRLSAAKATLDFTVRHLAATDLADRISELEGRAADMASDDR